MGYMKLFELDLPLRIALKVHTCSTFLHTSMVFLIDALHGQRSTSTEGLTVTCITLPNLAIVIKFLHVTINGCLP